jgi:transcriptional regulator with XRE-family HTH domain
MIIGDRVKSIRESKNLSQGDIEERSGLLRNYLSRVENGHTIPSVETLEKIARSLEMPLYQLMYDGEEAPVLVGPREDHTVPRAVKTMTKKLIPLLARMSPQDRKLLMNLASRVVKRHRK